MGRMSALETVAFAALFVVACKVCDVETVRYEPNWNSLDTRPLPSWYDEAKIGIFLHWGVFSVPAIRDAWFWYDWKMGDKECVDFMEKNYPPSFTYADFAPMFKAEFYNPEQWADIFNSSGARYLVLVAKHHEGYCNWPSKYSWNWNSQDVGPKRDLTGDLANAIRKKTVLRFGIYHSLFEFFNPLYLQDKANKWATQDFVRTKTLPELYELINSYEPEIVWSDGDWEAPDTYWNSTEFLAWLYNDSPVRDTVVTNDRWGAGTACKHGDFYNCQDKFNPGTLMKHKFEDCEVLDSHSWGFRRNAQIQDFKSMDEVTELIATIVSCGGNLLINAGPTPDGMIAPIFEERLRQMGQWLKVNGEAIYGSRPWRYQNDTVTKGVWYTSQKAPEGLAVYAIVLDWPTSDTLFLDAPLTSASTNVSLLGYPGNFEWQPVKPSGIAIVIPPIPVNQLPCQWAWVFKLTGLLN